MAVGTVTGKRNHLYSVMAAWIIWDWLGILQFRPCEQEGTLK